MRMSMKIIIGLGFYESDVFSAKIRMALSRFTIFILLTTGYGFTTSGQGVFSLSSGVGFPELVNAGVLYQLKDFQFDLTVGALPQANVSLLASSLGVQYHFGQSWKLLNQKMGGGGIYRSKGKGFRSQHPPWFVKTGLIYYREESELLIDKYYYLNLRFGREIGISRNIGMNITLGGVLKLLNSEVKKEPVRNLELEYPVLPAGGFSLFYQIR